jgi:hypothetical protein
MRWFCKRPGIKRDMRSGRPRAQITAKTAVVKSTLPRGKRMAIKAG